MSRRPAAVWSELIMWQEMIDWVAMGAVFALFDTSLVSMMSAGHVSNRFLEWGWQPIAWSGCVAFVIIQWGTTSSRMLFRIREAIMDTVSVKRR